MVSTATRSAAGLLGINGIGPAIAEKLQAAGIETLQDLLFQLPLKYQDRTTIVPIRALQNGSSAVVQGRITHCSVQYGKKRSLVCQLEDDTGSLQLRFFYFSKAQQAGLAEGTELRCFGDVSLGPRGLAMIHPEYQRGNELPEEQPQTLTPVYSSVAGLQQQRWRKWVKEALDKLSPEQLPHLVPASYRRNCQLPDTGSLHSALQLIHFPPPDIDQRALLEQRHPLQRSLALEELVAQRITQLQLKHRNQRDPAFQVTSDSQLEAPFRKALGFVLTGAQERVLADIRADLRGTGPMLRLLQGDVGSGKTVVAALAALLVADCGQQAALMAPTEILAEQHARSLRQWLEPLGISVELLVSKMSAADKRAALAKIADGSAQVVIGTHALIENSVEFNSLALAIVDEQHRFGVNQRHKLKSKRSDGLAIHQLVMTATPIPRTLAMTFCADLDYSVIDELPPGRTPIVTVAIDNRRREAVIDRVRNACLEGRQVYWVCTLVEESEALQCQAAETTASELASELSGISVGLVHGRVKADAKQRVMQAFKEGDIQLLVATTVIEVGVDVPNASLMVIENPERLGLAQLHQLRGRVGRGAVESHCVLLYQTPLSNNGKRRLALLRESNDGFVLAEEDLKLRGPGEVFGTRQSGALSLRIADLERDSDLIGQAVAASQYIFEKNPDAASKLQRRWCPEALKFSQV